METNVSQSKQIWKSIKANRKEGSMTPIKTISSTSRSLGKIKTNGSQSRQIWKSVKANRKEGPVTPIKAISRIVIIMEKTHAEPGPI